MNTNRVTRKRGSQKRKYSGEKLITKRESKREQKDATSASGKKKKRKTFFEKKGSAESVEEIDGNRNIIQTEVQVHSTKSVEDALDEIEVHDDAVSTSPPEFQAQVSFDDEKHSQGSHFSALQSYIQNEPIDNDVQGDSEMNQNESSTEFEYTGPTWKDEVKKDISALFKLTGNLVKSVNEIKHIVRERETQTKRSRASSYSTSDEDIKFALLPDFKLKKVRQVREMETNINENYMYKRQLVILFENINEFRSLKYISENFNCDRSKRCRLLEEEI